MTNYSFLKYLIANCIVMLSLTSSTIEDWRDGLWLSSIHEDGIDGWTGNAYYIEDGTITQFIVYYGDEDCPTPSDGYPLESEFLKVNNGTIDILGVRIKNGNDKGLYDDGGRLLKCKGTPNWLKERLNHYGVPSSGGVPAWVKGGWHCEVEGGHNYFYISSSTIRMSLCDIVLPEYLDDLYNDQSYEYKVVGRFGYLKSDDVCLMLNYKTHRLEDCYYVYEPVAINQLNRPPKAINVTLSFSDGSCNGNYGCIKWSSGWGSSELITIPFDMVWEYDDYQINSRTRYCYTPELWIYEGGSVNNSNSYSRYGLKHHGMTPFRLQSGTQIRVFYKPYLPGSSEITVTFIERRSIR